jgi:heptosyltransferase I
LDPASLRTHAFHRILLIKLSAVGDVIHTIPVLHKLRRRYPAARIDWLLRPQIAELIGHHPAITNVLPFARRDWERSWRTGGRMLRNLADLVGEMRATRYELAIDLQGQFRTALFTLASRAPVRIGFDRPRREVWQATERKLPPEAYRHGWKGAREGSWIAYTHPIRIATLDMHAVDRYLRVGDLLGLDDGPADFSFVIPPTAVARADELLSRSAGRGRGSGLVVLAPGTMWETKHWTAEGFAAVARHFLDHGRAVVLIGSAGDRRVCAEIVAAAPGAVDLAGRTTLTELAEIVRRASLCVTNDSGPMHLAVALQRPVVSIFGPSDALWIGPYRRPDAVISAQVPCAPCYLRTLRRCPNNHACMRAVSPTDVIERAERSLAAAGANVEVPVDEQWTVNP